MQITIQNEIDPVELRRSLLLMAKARQPVLRLFLGLRRGSPKDFQRAVGIDTDGFHRQALIQVLAAFGGFSGSPFQVRQASAKLGSARLRVRCNRRVGRYIFD